MPIQVKRLLIVFAIFIALFLVLRHFLIPDHFGELGHYRTASLKENEDKEVKYVGTQVCINCHDSIAKLKASGPHSTIVCEACHGAGYKHVKAFEADISAKPDTNNKLLKPSGRVFCGRCHALNPARRKNVIKQVDLKEHNVEGDCIECHENPHKPVMP